MTRRPTPCPEHATLRGLATAFLFLIACLAPAGARADSPTLPATVRLTSLEWPPFSGAGLANGGLSTAIVARTLAKAGMVLAVEFLPWQRAVSTGLHDDGYLGYYPEYASAGLEGGRCLMSDPIGSSPLGFAERMNTPVEWRILGDLKDRRIGTVRGYVNTDAFDRAAAEGSLNVEPAVDDATNLRKLAAGRLDLVVIDANVMNHLLSTGPDLRHLRDQLRFNSRLLEDKTLHVCFRPGPEGEALRHHFNRALALGPPESVLEAVLPQAKR